MLGEVLFGAEPLLCRLHRRSCRFGFVLILVGGLRCPYCAWAACLLRAACPFGVVATATAATDIHTYKQHKVQRRIGDAPGPPTIRPGWHLGDFNDPFCATTQLTPVLSTEKEIINRPPLPLPSPFMCLVVFWCCAVSVGCHHRLIRSYEVLRKQNAGHFCSG